jgi:drug/metabolite transporter (DMT)-like permease
MSAAARKAELKASAGLVLTAFLWGTMVPFTGSLLATLDPLVIAAARYAIAVPVLFGLAALMERQADPMPAIPWGRVLLLGGPGMAGFAACYTYGIRWSDPVTAAIILAINPVVSVVLAWALDGVRTGPKLLGGIALATSGSIVAGLARPNAGGGSFHGGELLLVGGSMLWTWYSLRAQTWLAGRGIGQIRLTALTTGASALWLAVALAAAAALGHAHLPATVPTPLVVAQVLWLGVLATGAAIVFWNAGVSTIGVPLASLFVNLAPLFAIAISTLFGFVPTAGQLVGAAIVIAGVLWIQVVKLREARAARRS